MLKGWTLGKSLLGIEFQKQMQQQTRQVRIRKPPWAGRAKNKLFRVPPLHIQDQTEKAFMRPIWYVLIRLILAPFIFYNKYIMNTKGRIISLR